MVSRRLGFRRASSAGAVVAVVAAAIAVPITAPQQAPGSSSMIIAIARADCPPDCGGNPGGGNPSGPPGGGTEFVPPSMPAMPSYEPGRGQPPLDQNNGISIYNSAAPQPGQAVQPSQAPAQNQDGSYNRAANGEQQPINYNSAPENQQLDQSWNNLSNQLNQGQPGQSQQQPSQGNSSEESPNQSDDSNKTLKRASCNGTFGEGGFSGECSDDSAQRETDPFRCNGPGTDSIQDVILGKPRPNLAADSFRKLLGRDPATSSDWETARALDRRNPKLSIGDTFSQIKVARIRPVPGNGVVQVNLYIPTDKVVNLHSNETDRLLPDNMGDNRGPNPSATPDMARVALLVDFENGLAVARQNPSVELPSGIAKTAIPEVSLSQQQNGEVIIKYDAHDAFVPDWRGLPSVNGTLGILPTGGIPQVGGNTTEYPSLEVNQWLPDGTVRQILSAETEWSQPEFGLPFHHDVGDASLVHNAIVDTYQPARPMTSPCG
ncbi:hypothetical protein MBOL_27400 [Mycobacteroides abscessus subsp. bolletii BD]|nr:hypothetical protein MBOL_27400 [Mycobacteroides abscessus subsp. bolletii BD]